MSELADEIIRISRHFGVFEREGVCCGSITVPQCLTLQHLLDGPTAMTTLAAQAGASLSSMTRLVDGLERHGWIERTRSGDDRRRVTVALTPAGRRQAKQLREQTLRMLDGFLARIPRGKRRQVLESLRLLRTAMDEVRSSSCRSCC